MRPFPEATPCPAVDATSHGRRVSFAQDTTSILNPADDTENVDFTTELHAQFRNAKPRRRASVMAKRGSFQPSIDIWEDAGREESAANGARARRTSILERPAARAPVAGRKIGGAAMETAAETARIAPGASLMAAPARPRRASGILAGHAQQRRTSITGAAHLPVERPPPQASLRSDQLKRDPRRRTIYIPSEDTTIETIHPGVLTQLPEDTWMMPKRYEAGLDLVTVTEEEASGSLAMEQQKKPSRKSLAVKPRKAPLQQSRHQEANTTRDVFGQGYGKENVPPGMGRKGKLDSGAGPADIVIHFDDADGPAAFPHATLDRRSTVYGTGSTSYIAKSGPLHARPSLAAGQKRMGSASLLSTSVKVARAEGIDKSEGAHAASIKPLNRLEQSTMETVKLTHSSHVLESSTYRASVIGEDLIRPELYEDHWLSHQEIAIAQCLNSLLKVGEDSNDRGGSGSLRKQLVKIYNTDDTVALYKRIQASMRYGALAIPKDALPKVGRLDCDVGLRRKFFSLWLDSYDHSLLTAALETVVGRELTIPTRLSDPSSGPREGKMVKRVKRGLEQYINAFIILHEDSSRAQPALNSIGNIARTMEHSSRNDEGLAWKWRRSMTRSLMLVLLLDRAKANGLTKGRLFQKSSAHKSSASVLNALADMLFPSLGDISRPLNHLTYRLTSVQYPLEEFDYNISNLATDLRDGIVLARIIELLFYHSKVRQQTHDSTMTLALPTGEILSSGSAESAHWVLSQHLKLPCPTRAQKLYNVQISLSALANLGGAPYRVAKTIAAEDVVDGHREKTLGLLLGLLGHAGNGLLVDEASVRAELDRLSGTTTSTHRSGHPKHSAELLQAWATAVGCRHNITIDNLTTSFADGRALEALVDEYLPYNRAFDGQRSENSTSDREGAPQSLASKLKSIGCSASFVSLFAVFESRPGSVASNRSYPSSRSFTLLTLSYLASRLLPLATARRAALSIQRWYRRVQARRNASRRLRLMCLAHDCATVVNTRATVIGAATVIQRAWRAVLRKRRDVLMAEVAKVQACIRGWRYRRSVLLNVDGSSKLARRGGW